LLPPERTAREVDFIERTLTLPPCSTILDLCCGQGRHAVSLAERGYAVTGLDLSTSLLAKAEKEAKGRGVPLHLVYSDMRRIPFTGEFDAVINVFTAFGYLESDAEDQKVLRQVAKTLKPGGKFLIDIGNREYVIRNYRPQEWTAHEDGTVDLRERRFDFLTGRNHETIIIVKPDGSRREQRIQVRMYTLAEMTAMLAKAGLSLEATYGGFQGEEYGLDSRRMILLARK